MYSYRDNSFKLFHASNGLRVRGVFTIDERDGFISSASAFRRRLLAQSSQMYGSDNNSMPIKLGITNEQHPRIEGGLGYFSDSTCPCIHGGIHRPTSGQIVPCGASCHGPSATMENSATRPSTHRG